MIPCRLRLFLSLICLVSISAHSSADVRLPGFFGDHMVMQQNTDVRVWGWADQGETVTVTIGENSTTATPDKDGRWDATLPAIEGSKTPHTLVVKGKNTVEVKDIRFGEVWLCSGQSNMEWTVSRSANAAEEIAAADYPTIRHMKVDRKFSTTPINDIESTWQICSPETAGNFTAAGYFMARKLTKELDVPIGLINSSWGGTRVEPWTAPVGFQKVNAVQDIYRSVLGRTPGSDPFNEQLSKHIAATEAWLIKAKGSLSEGTTLGASPTFPQALTPFKIHQDPTVLYNSMIHALVGYPIRGAIWYQGESNHAEGMLYTEKKRALINGWRELWGQGDFPFYFVQIAPYQYGNEDPAVLAQFWEAQAAVQEIPNTGMVVINDIATLNDIHPPNKQDVGDRLALLALKHDYGRDDTVAHSPEMASMEVLEDSVKVNFKNTGGGLKTRDGKSVSHLEVIGPGSRGYHPAVGTIDGESIVITSETVKSPVAFRFAWHKLAQPNLVGGTGLPVGAVRGGEEPDLLSLLSIEDDYQLVYEIDLANLKHDIEYAVDHSDKISSFDRIGYLVQLNSGHSGEQTVFVSMNAFTDDVKKIGIPTNKSGARFQQQIESMDVYSSHSGITGGNEITTGSIEFWPNNYGPGNGNSVPGASPSVFDFGDEPGPPVDGYGCMQVHNFGAKQTIFAINQWKGGGNADIGIGNSSGKTRDWTFSGNASSYSSKRLRVYVRGN